MPNHYANSTQFGHYAADLLDRDYGNPFRNSKWISQLEKRAWPKSSRFQKGKDQNHSKPVALMRLRGRRLHEGPIFS